MTHFPLIFPLIIIETCSEIFKLTKMTQMLHYTVIFESMKKIMDFRKKKIEKTVRAAGLKSESIMPITIYNRLDLWYGIIHSFFNFFFFF